MTSSRGQGSASSMDACLNTFSRTEAPIRIAPKELETLVPYESQKS